MPKHGKNFRKALEGVNLQERLSVEDAVSKSLGASFAKFDETVDVAIRLGVDPKYSDQMVRGAVTLPHGLGKTVRVAVFCKGEKQAEATAAGADFVGAEDLVAKIKEGWLDFDAAVATPDVMALVGQIGRLLGPRGLMPNAKTGSVTFDVTKAVNEGRARGLQGRQGRCSARSSGQGFLRSRKDPGQPQGPAGNRESSEALRRQGHLHALHGGVHHHGPRLQDRHVPGEKIPGRLSPFFS